jgi:methyl-accepting chemotaxis protein
VRAFNNLKVGTKLIGGFLAVSLIMVIVAAVGYNGMRLIGDNLDGIYSDNLQQTMQLAAADGAIDTLEDATLHAVIDPQEASALEAAMTAQSAIVTDQMGQYRSASLGDDEKAVLVNFDAAWPVYQRELANVLAQIKAGNQSAAQQALAGTGPLATAHDAMNTSIDKLKDIQAQDAQASKAEADAAQAAAVRQLLIVGVLGGLLAVGLGLFISRAITRPLAQVARAAEGIATGDLNQSLTIRSRDEIGQMAGAFSCMILYLQGMAGAASQIADGDLTASVTPQSERDVLGQAFARMLANLRRALGQVAANAATVDMASKQLASAAIEAGQATNQIASTMQQVAKGTAQQTEGVTKTAHSAEEMRRAIDGVAKGAQDQAQAVAVTSSAMTKMAQSVAAIRQGAQAQRDGMAQAQQAQVNVRESLSAMQTAAQSVAGAAEQSAKAAQAGTQRAAQSVASMGRVRATNDQLAGRVRDLGKRTGQIGAIIETIDEIASQTNLLALNAAIEAARAGEHGKGFAVVADEVRKLAERSAIATKEISQMIGAVQSGAAEVVEAMQTSGADVGAAASATESAGTAFEEIAAETQALLKQVQAIDTAAAGMAQASTALEQVVGQAAQVAVQNQQAADAINALNNQVVAGLDNVSAVVEENTAATEQMAAGATEVTQSIENIASVSEENSAAVEEVSASTEQMSAQVEEVTASAQSLADMAQALEDVVSQFKLAAEPAPAQPPTRPARGQATPAATVRVRTDSVAHGVNDHNGHAATRSANGGNGRYEDLPTV